MKTRTLDLAKLSFTAHRRLPRLVARIEALIRVVDPIELLAQLTLLYQIHREDEHPNIDEMARWQARIEWLAWLMFSHRISAPETPALIGEQILGPLERLLDAYFQASSVAV